MRLPDLQSLEGAVMKFIDVHNDMKGITREQLAAEHQKDLEAQAGTDVHFHQAWADPSTGKVFCLSEGPSRGAVLAVHERAGHPTDELYEVPIEVG
jgi:hypothetical protein